MLFSSGGERKIDLRRAKELLKIFANEVCFMTHDPSSSYLSIFNIYYR